MNRRHNIISLIGASVLANIGASALIDQSAFAQTADENTSSQIETVTVTANLREENMQKVPIEIMSLSGDEADKLGVKDLEGLQQIVPGLEYNRNNSSGLISIRGLGPPTGAVGFEGPVSVYLDDVYMPSPVGNMLSLVGMDRVEVDNGPQGTLFGRNSLGGAIRVMTKEPDPSASATVQAEVGYANYDTTSGEFYGATPISSTMAVSLAASASNQGKGWGHNLATDQDVHLSQEFSLNPKFVWKPDDQTEVTAWVFYQTLRDDLGMADAFIPGSKGVNGVTTAPADFYDVNQDLTSFYTDRQVTASVQAQHNFGWATLKSITAYSKVTSQGQKDSDDDPTPLNYSYQQPSDQTDSTFTQEFRLVSPQNDDRVKWVAGLFYFNDISSYDPVRVAGSHNTASCSPPTAPTACSYYDIADSMLSTSYAGYAQATARLLDNLNLTGGIRYTNDWRHIHGGNYGSNGFVFGYGDQRKSWGEFTYKGALDYAITDDILAYVSYSTGFNSGTFNTGSPNQPPVNPATLDATEGGIKSQLFGGRLRLNLAGFYYDYNNMVLKQLQPNASNILYNAAKARLYGLDAQFEAELTTQWSFQGALEFLHTEFLSFDNAPATVLKASGGDSTIYVNYQGQPIFNAPKFTASLGTQYTFPLTRGQITLGAQYQYNSGFNWVATANANGQITDRDASAAYSLLNLSADWTSEDGKWDVRLWGKNVTGTEYYEQVEASSYGDHYTPAPPATFGVTVGVKY